MGIQDAAKLVFTLYTLLVIFCRQCQKVSFSLKILRHWLWPFDPAHLFIIYYIYYSRITLDWTKSEVAAIYRISSHKWIQTQFMAQSSVGCAVVNLHISQILRGHLFCWLRAQRAGADVSATRCVRRQKERWSVCEEWGERCRRLTRKLYVLAWRLTAAWRNERRRPCARLNWGLGVKATRQDRVTVVCRWAARSGGPLRPGRRCRWLMRDSRSLWCLLFALQSGNDRLGQMSHAHAMTPSFPFAVIRAAESRGGGREAKGWPSLSTNQSVFFSFPFSTWHSVKN